MNTCDIIIPTYNSERVLPLTLNALQKQHIPDGWMARVIISDDGSSDGTVEKLPITNYQLPITVLPSVHTGRAGARNRAIERSDADVLFFLGADIILRPDALSHHLRWYDAERKDADAALGMVKWDPRVSPSPCMEWMAHGGQQNDFDSIIGKQFVDPSHFFYGSHVSIQREALGTVRFPELYSAYGWEDLDVGRQLARRGVRLVVLHRAVGLHYHYYSVRDILERQYNAGRSVHVYQRRFAGERIVPQRTFTRETKHSLYRWSGVRLPVRWLISMLGCYVHAPRLFSFVTAAEFWCGYDSGSKQR